MKSKSFRLRAGAALVLSYLFAAGISAAEAAPFYLTSPGTDTIDDWPAAVAFGTGFQLVWQHYESDGKSSIRTRRFGGDGKPLSVEKTQAAPGALVGRPRILPAYGGKLGLVWLDTTTGLTGATFDPATGAFAKSAGFGKPSAAYYDVARLSNGNVAAAHVYLDTTNTSNIRLRAAVSTATASFVGLTRNVKLFGSDNVYTSPGSADQAIVADGAGGALAFYRDRTDGHLYVVKVSAKGASGWVRTRVDTTKMSVGGAAQMGNFGVDAVRLGDGRYAVVWTSVETSDASLAAVRLRYLDATGKPVGTDVRVDSGTGGGQMTPRLVALPSARLGVSWIQDEGRTRYHRVRWYTAKGIPVAPPVTLRSDTEIVDFAGIQPVTMSDGRVLQVWRSYDTTLKRYRIRGEFLMPPK
jgi:hypothetical protein